MKRRSRTPPSPATDSASPDRSGATSNSADGAAGRDRVAPSPHTATLPVPRWFAAVLAAGLIGYIVLFFQVPAHRQWLMYPLIPDALLQGTWGGDLRQFTWFDRAPVIALAALIGALAWGIGRLGLVVLKLPDAMTRVEQTTLGLLLGLALLSTWTLLTGWLVGLDRVGLIVLPPILAALAGTGLAISRGWRAVTRPTSAPTAGSSASSNRSVEHGSPFASADRGTAGSTAWEGPGVPRWLWWLVPWAMLLLCGSLVPPWEFDVLEYHLQVPKEWHQTGRIGFVPHNVYGNMPLGAEMHALLAMTLAPGPEAWWWGALAGKTVTGLTPLIVAGLLWSAGTRCWSSRAGAIAAVLYVATPWVVQTSLAGLIDSYFGGFLFGASYALWRGWRTARASVANESRTGQVNGESRTREILGWYALSGLLAGGAAACKYPGVVFVVLPLSGAASVLAWRHLPFPRTAAAALLLFAGGVVVGGGSWYAKNAVECGNPVYPLLYGVFGGGTRTPAQDEQWRAAHRPGGNSGTSYSVGQLAESAAQIGWRSPWLSPLLLPLACVALLTARTRSVVLPWVALIVFILAVWWLATHRIDRFWIPLLPVLALLAGGALEPLERCYGQRAVQAGLAAGLVLQLLVALSPGEVGEPFGNTQFFLPLEQLREESTPAGQREVNRRVPPDQAVLLVGDARPFYVRPRCYYATCFDHDALEHWLGGRDTAARRAAVQSAGITHILIDWSEIARYRSPGNYGFPDYVTPARVRDELLEPHGLLRPVPTPDLPEHVELFAVAADGPREGAPVREAGRR
ncbi:MAG: hypothetical protein U0935_01080 [Pirellulales bacterium]